MRRKFLTPKMLFDASKWPWKVPDPNFPNWDLPLKWIPASKFLQFFPLYESDL
jgi:hypothetical protein